MSKVTSTDSWDGIRNELLQMMDGMLERIKQKTGRQSDGHFPTITEREELVVALGKEIGEYLLEKSILMDPVLIEVLLAKECDCPKCHTPSKRKEDAEKKAKEESVMVNTAVGKLPFAAPIFGCQKCRRDFSPGVVYWGLIVSITAPLCLRKSVGLVAIAIRINRQKLF